MTTPALPWEAMHEHASKVTKTGDTVWTIEYVRDFLYREGSAVTPRWLSKIIDTNTVTEGYFYSAPLKQFGLVGGLAAHSALGFYFKDGTNILYSIEVRQPLGTDFALGMHGETVRIFTTHENLVGFRRVVRKQPFFRFPLTVPHHTLSTLLTSCLTDAQKNFSSTDTYSLLNNHCSTALMHVINSSLAHALPWHPSYHLTALLPNFLARKKILSYARGATFK